MLKLLRALMSDRKGATAVEYGLILALIFLAVIASVKSVATATIDMWDYVSEKVVGTENPDEDS